MALFRLSKMVEPEPLLRGDGIYLRPAAITDFPAWARLRAESRAFLTPWEPTWPEDDLTRASFRRRLRRQSEEISRDESYPFLIFEATSDTLLGGLTLGGIRRGVAQAGTLGYWMGAPHAGKGYMRRAVAAAARHAFSTLRLHRIEAACLPQNIASMSLLERNGFQREGLARAYLKINGAWRDHVLYARIEPEAPRLG
jgi:ribosomal-protein-alanine N-acetyltransferase